jgi:hypothetical protein
MHGQQNIKHLSCIYLVNHFYRFPACYCPSSRGITVYIQQMLMLYMLVNCVLAGSGRNSFHSGPVSRQSTKSYNAINSTRTLIWFLLYESIKTHDQQNIKNVLSSNDGDETSIHKAHNKISQNIYLIILEILTADTTNSERKCNY